MKLGMKGARRNWGKPILPASLMSLLSVKLSAPTVDRYHTNLTDRNAVGPCVVLLGEWFLRFQRIVVPVERHEPLAHWQLHVSKDLRHWQHCCEYLKPHSCAHLLLDALTHSKDENFSTCWFSLLFVGNPILELFCSGQGILPVYQR